MKTPRVFGIGFPKTGTTSLARALKLLGYRVIGPNGVYDPNIRHNVLRRARWLGRIFDAFQDEPWPYVFKDLDALFPGSKFVLTFRPTDRWIASMVRHFGRKGTPMNEWTYGPPYPEGHEATYIARYERHLAEVRDYFKDRPADLLIMDLAAGDGWEKLCPFLGLAIPAKPFPHANKATDRERRTANPFIRLYRMMRKLFMVVTRY